MKNGDMPVGPMLNEYGCPHHHSSILMQDGQVTGLTKRELFAAMAMQGIRTTMQHMHSRYADVAGMAVDQADALLAALEKSK